MQDRTPRRPGAPAPVSRARRAATEAIPLLIPAVLLLALLAFIDHDPVRGVTASRSPFSDEAWSFMNARNLVRLGTWAPDDWHLYLVNLPFSILEAGTFQLLGVGIVQARLVSVIATAATAGLIAIGLRGTFGRVPAAVAAIAFASSTLVLYYGRLALLEPLVAASLTLGVVLAARAGGERAGRFGLLAGLALAIAIGTKPNAGFAAVGILVGVALVGARGDPAARRWLGGAVIAIGTCGLAWLAALGLPHLDEVAADVRIWPQQHLPRSIGDLLYSIAHYPFSSDGAIPATLPLGLAGIAGFAGSVARWRDVDPTTRRLVAASAGWLVLGTLPLLILSYHPNRYVVPLLPALSILLAAGLAAIGPRLSRMTARRRWAAIMTLVVALALPGSLAYGAWIAGSPRTLVATQADFERLLPADAVVEGDFAPLFAMTTHARTIVAWPGAAVNAGDVYASQGVRWLVVAPDAPPPWVARHPTAWSGRRSLTCLTWGDDDVCLFSLP